MNGRPKSGQLDRDDEELKRLQQEISAVSHRLEVIARNVAHKLADLEYRIALVIEKRRERF